ncbi:hypothetical protein Tco_0905720 [Tanacetum coccineum]
MGDENQPHTLGDYSQPSHEGYRNTIELPEGNNVVPLRSDTIRFVQNGCSFHKLQFEDPNQHSKDFLRLVDSLHLNEYTKGKSSEKVLVREEVGKPVTKYVNAVSLVRIENDKCKKGDAVVDKNIVEPIKLVENEEAMDDVKDNELDRSVNEDSTRWGKYVDRLMEMPRL